jgi:hypothetical protein
LCWVTSVVEPPVEPVAVDDPVVAVVVVAVDEVEVEAVEFPDELLEPQPLTVNNKPKHARGTNAVNSPRPYAITTRSPLHC